MVDDFSGPVIFSYVWWIMHEAVKRGIKRLYFLARDGYTLLKIAQLFCERFKLDIECRYLYCSRKALRMPTFFFIGNETFDLLFQWGNHVTLRTVLLRADLTAEERKNVYVECGLDGVDENRRLSKKEFTELSIILRDCKSLRSYIDNKSKSACDTAVGYFRQEGLFDQKLVAIVDSGWTGSMQRSLRQLLEFARPITTQLVGFYFGMYSKPQSTKDGEYLTWYFNSDQKISNKVFFNNNLFECLLAAPHGMTDGYMFQSGVFCPRLINEPLDEIKNYIKYQSEILCDFAAEKLIDTDFIEFPASKLLRITKKKLKKYMCYPRRMESEYYRHFLFCDDSTDLYLSPLVSEQEIYQLKNYIFLKRLINKFRKTSGDMATELYWPYGTVSYLPIPLREWYRINILLWDFIKYLKGKG